MKQKASLIIVIFSFQFLFVDGQNINPDFNEIYNPNEISKIYLTLSASDLQALLYPDDPYVDIYYPAEFHFQNSLLDTVLGPVGIRIRGNTSRASQKRSYKIDFKEYGGEQFLKLKKMNLKPNNNDPSMLRESLSWQMYRMMNVPAARTAYVELYMNDNFFGVYQNVENIDDEFVDRRYGSENGNLYKCKWGADLSNANAIYNNDLYELKTNEEINDRSKLFRFLEIVNDPSSDNWEAELESVFNVDNYLRQLAVEATIGHWDGYAYNTNNYYLYENPATNKIEYIPYDLDNTWGIDWLGIDWGTENITSWYSKWLQIPLVSQILKVDEYRNKFYSQLSILMDSYFNIDYIEPLALNYRDLIAESVREDTWYSLDFGYSYEDFYSAYYNAWGRQVAYSINDYIETRTQNTKSQLKTTDIENRQLEANVYPNPVKDFLNVNLSSFEIVQLKIMGLDGRVYLENEMNEGKKINVSFLEQGTYILQLSYRREQYSQLIIKK